MTPRVEGLETSPYIGYHRYFSVDLSHSEAIDINLFDQQAKALGKNDGILIIVRFLVVNRQQREEMFVMPVDINHWQLYERLYEQEPCIPLSAGLIKLTFLGNQTKREICDNSPSLELARILMRKKSDQYKEKELKEKLGSSFEIR